MGLPQDFKPFFCQTCMCFFLQRGVLKLDHNSPPPRLFFLNEKPAVPPQKPSARFFLSMREDFQALSEAFPPESAPFFLTPFPPVLLESFSDLSTPWPTTPPFVPRALLYPHARLSVMPFFLHFLPMSRLVIGPLKRSPRHPISRPY